MLMISLPSPPGVEPGDVRSCSLTWTLVRSRGPEDSELFLGFPGPAEARPGPLQVVLAAVLNPFSVPRSWVSFFCKNDFVAKAKSESCQFSLTPLFNS